MESVRSEGTQEGFELRETLRSTAVVLAVVFATACGSAGDVAGPATTPAATRSALVGPTWRLVSVDGRKALAGVSVTAVFGEDDRVTGSAGCNQYFGRAAATGAQLDVGPLAATRRFCAAEGVMAQEQAYLAALERAETYRVAGAGLELGPAPGVITLVFTVE